MKFFFISNPSNLGKFCGEMVAVLVEEVVLVALELFTQVLHNLGHIIHREVCPAQHYRLSEMQNEESLLLCEHLKKI